MECQASDSKKLFKVFDASKRKRGRKKRDGHEMKSQASDGSIGGSRSTKGLETSVKASLQDIPSPEIDDNHDNKTITRDSSPTLSRSPGSTCRLSKSPRRHRRSTREGLSLALKAGLVSTPRSLTPPPPTGETANDTLPQDHDSFIYAFLEEAIKRDKKKQRHSKRHEARHDGRNESRHETRASERNDSRHETRTSERLDSREREASQPRERRHHRRRRDDTRDRDKPPKFEAQPAPAIDQTALLAETFAKLCASLNKKPSDIPGIEKVQRTLSHKSLQCEVVSKNNSHDLDHRPIKLRSGENSRENISSTRNPSPDTNRGRVRSHENVAISRSHLPADLKEKCLCCNSYDRDNTRYASRLDVTRSKMQNVADRQRDYPSQPTPTRSCLDYSYRMRSDTRTYREFDEAKEPFRGRNYDEERRRFSDQKTSRSFNVHREGYADENKSRRTARSDVHREKRYDDRQYDERDRDTRYEDFEQRDKYYEDKPLVNRDRYYNNNNRERRSKKNQERFERASVVSRDDDYKEKDRFSERERDSGLSVADGETSTISGRSNCLRVVKQEIIEQREAMDKMMKLWKELMRCFKGISQPQGSSGAVHETAANNVRESAAAQLSLWRECMRRYETVARDVGDTDARLMEEINKQRSEMSEMASMWQECLQRYREISTDFNNLKQKLASDSPTRPPAPPLPCAEGEGTAPPTPYHLPPVPYPPMGPTPGYGSGSPVRARAAPPAWWWADQAGPPGAPPTRRRSSPESRGSRDRERDRDRDRTRDRDRDRDRDRRHRHKDRDREDTRHREKSKPSAARSEHRHRKR